jgi:PEP-CTERM motif
MRVSLFAATLALCAISITAHASPVKYTLSGTMSGSLGADTFTDAVVTFTFLGDTSGIDSSNAFLGVYTNTDGTSTVSIAGLGTASFTSSTFGVESSALGFNGSAGFTDSGFNIGMLDPNLAAYDLSAPFTDTGFFVDGSFLSLSGPEATSLGDLNITDGDFQNPTTTFTASALSSVPEPSSFMLLGTGLVGLIGAARRRLA